MFQDEEFVAFELATSMSMLTEFREIFGMRFLGLEDPAGQAYASFGYPNAEAPYPRDIVIDRAGIVRYWSTEYEPQKIIEIIRRLLFGTASAGQADQAGLRLLWDPAVPNPSRGEVTLSWESPGGGWSLDLLDAAGRRLGRLGFFPEPGRHFLRWDGRDRSGRRLPAGVYFLRLKSARASASQRILRVD